MKKDGRWAMKYTKYDILYCPECKRSERFLIHAAFAECSKCGKKLVRVSRVVEASNPRGRGLSPAV
jgi:hypothetical protein